MAQPEMQSFAAALACLALLYALLPRLPAGLPRLLLVLPCLPVFAWVPFSARAVSLRATLSFSFLWICPSRLLLLSCDPSPEYPGHGFLYFIFTTVLPVRVKGGAPPSAHVRKQGSVFLHVLKFLLFFVVLNASRYRESVSPWTLHALYCLLVYLGLDWELGLFAKLVNALLGVETYPQSDNPFLASSLEEFWSRRWNLVATNMLRETVYAPVLHLLLHAQWQDAAKRTFDAKQRHMKAGNNARTTSNARIKTSSSANEHSQSRGLQQNSTLKHQKLQQESSAGEGHGKSKHPLPARAIAMLASFLVSGLIHELVFCCINQTHATWEVTMFFILHGFATVLELFLRRKLPAGWKLPWPVAVLCTLGFTFFTAAWLFMPPITRAGSDLRIIAEFHQVQSVILHLFEKH